MSMDAFFGGTAHVPISRIASGPKKNYGKVSWQNGLPISPLRASVCEVNKSSAKVQKKLRVPEKSAFELSQIRCLSHSQTSHPTSATDSAIWPLRSGSA